MTSPFPIATEDSADPTAEAPSGDKAGWSPHLSDVLIGGEGRGQVPPDRILAPSPASLTPILTGLPPVQHRHCGNPGCKTRAAAPGMLSFLSPSLSTRGNHCLGANVPACSCTHTSLCSGGEVHSLPCGLRRAWGGVLRDPEPVPSSQGLWPLVVQSFESAQVHGDRQPAMLALVWPRQLQVSAGRK